jgi:hypothetical protein
MSPSSRVSSLSARRRPTEATAVRKRFSQRAYSKYCCDEFDEAEKPVCAPPPISDVFAAGDKAATIFLNIFYIFGVSFYFYVCARRLRHID